MQGGHTGLSVFDDSRLPDNSHSAIFPEGDSFNPANDVSHVSNELEALQDDFNQFEASPERMEIMPADVSYFDDTPEVQEFNQPCESPAGQIRFSSFVENDEKVIQ